MRRLAMITLITAALVGVTGCTPDSLEGFEPANNANNANNINNVNNTNNTNNGGTFTPEFVAVSGTLAQECGQPACHGSSAANAFVLPTDQNATPAEMQAALTGKSGISGLPLIAAGNAAGSDIWDRMTKMTSDPQYMPLGGKVLTMEQYNSIETWINNGAVYTQ